jgi:hypothetical protein
MTQCWTTPQDPYYPFHRRPVELACTRDLFSFEELQSQWIPTGTGRMTAAGFCCRFFGGMELSSSCENCAYVRELKERVVHANFAPFPQDESALETCQVGFLVRFGGRL